MEDINIRNRSKLLKVLRKEVNTKLDLLLLEDYDNTDTDIKKDNIIDVGILKENDGE